jgi:hypothetical protein
MILSAFTLVHVVLNPVGIGAGFVVAYGLLTSKRLARWTTLFLTTTVATSVTGFFSHFMASRPAWGSALCL